MLHPKNYANDRNLSFPTPIKVDIGLSEKKIFKCYADIKNFFTYEGTFFKNLYRTLDESFYPVLKYVLRCTEELEYDIAMTGFQESSDSILTLIKKVEKDIEAYYSSESKPEWKDKLIASESPEGEFLKKLQKDYEAMFGLDNSALAMEGAVCFFLQRKGGVVPEPSGKDVDGGRHTLEGRLQAWNFERRQEAERMLQEAKKAHEEAKNAKDTFDQQAEAIKEKLSVDEAVDYWGKRANRCRRIAQQSGIVSGVLILCTVIGIWCSVSYILCIKSTDIGKHIFTESGALHWWIYGVSLTTLGLVIWLIRLVVRVFLSHLSLISDASERRTMIQTYQAFLEKGDIDSKDRGYILPAIFRQTATGGAKGSASPSTSIGIINKPLSAENSS